MSKSLEQHLKEISIALGRSQSRADLIDVLRDIPDDEMPIELTRKIFAGMEAKRVEREKTND